MLSYLRELCAVPGVSGDESRVRALIAQELAGFCTLRDDALGNLIAEHKGHARAKNRLVLFAHMDEVGLMITRITPEGLLKFSSIGMDPRVLHGRRVRVGESGLPGVIGSKVLHHLTGDEKDKKLTADALYIDIGAKGSEDAAALVSPGDTVTIDEPFAQFGEGFVAARAIDDRAGCAALLKLLRSELPYDLTGVFTTCEESSLAGAAAAANALSPDIAVILETTTAGDICGAAPEKRVCSLGSGPVVSFADNGALYNRELYRHAFALAKEAGIPIQTKEGVFGGNEARVVSRAGAGAKVLAVSLPCRYLHSASCVAKLEDMQNLLALVRLLAERLPVL